jgi:hypothetical protein
MGNKLKNRKTLPDEVLTSEVPLVAIEEQKENAASPTYVVVRNGVRVSDRDYSNPGDTRAIAEKEFWQRVVTRYPDGTRIEIVPFDKKKHRIW